MDVIHKGHDTDLGGDGEARDGHGRGIALLNEYTGRIPTVLTRSDLRLATGGRPCEVIRARASYFTVRRTCGSRPRA